MFTNKNINNLYSVDAVQNKMFYNTNKRGVSTIHDGVDILSIRIIISVEIQII